MADSEVEPHVKLLGVKLKSSTVLENIVAGAVLALVGYVLLDVFNAFSNQLGWLMPKPSSTLANAIDMAKIGFATIFAGAFAYYINHLGLWTGNDAALTRLRTRLAAGESAGAWYAHTVRSAIFVTDRFFGDAGKARQSWMPNAFRLKKAAPLWTAASYDKCLLVALVYPLLSIFLIWIGFNDAGGAGTALGLIQSGAWVRFFSFILVVAVVFCFVMASRTGGLRRLFWRAFASVFAFVVALAFASVVADTFPNANAVGGAATLTITFAFLSRFLFSGEFPGTLAFASAFVSIFVFAGAFYFAGAGLGAGVVLCGIAYAGYDAKKQNQAAIFFGAFRSLCSLLVCWCPWQAALWLNGGQLAP
jgi:hypothetical protein